MGFIVIMFLSYITYADPTVTKKSTVTDLANGLYWGVVSEQNKITNFVSLSSILIAFLYSFLLTHGLVKYVE